jgi:hypothetical protein
MNRLLRSVAVALSLLLTACSGGAPDKAYDTNFAGTWAGSAARTGSANPTFTLDLKQEGRTVTGIITSRDGAFRDVEIQDAVIADGALTFHARANGSPQFQDHLFLFSARRSGNTVEGTWTDILEGAQGPFTLHAVQD